MKNVIRLSDDELNECVSQDVQISLIRKILEKNDVVANSNYVNVDEFAQWFAHYLESKIGAPVDSEDWDEEWDINYELGENIAESINNTLEENKNQLV